MKTVELRNIGEVAGGDGGDVCSGEDRLKFERGRENFKVKLGFTLNLTLLSQ